jgi:hypothetical protein
VVEEEEEEEDEETRGYRERLWLQTNRFNLLRARNESNKDNEHVK